MAEKRMWVIEEIDVDGQIDHRQTAITFSDITGDLSRPDGRLGAAGEAEWDRVMLRMTNVLGEDLRHVINGVALMDHCLDVQNGRNHRQRGSTNRP
jgi:hypothetical protein